MSGTIHWKTAKRVKDYTDAYADYSVWEVLFSGEFDADKILSALHYKLCYGRQGMVSVSRVEKVNENYFTVHMRYSIGD